MQIVFTSGIRNQPSHPLPLPQPNPLRTRPECAQCRYEQTK